MTQTSKTLPSAHGPNSCQYETQTPRGGYRIQIAWPLCWGEDRSRPADDYPVSTLYLVDGNAYFQTAVDVSRRLEFTDNARTVVVGIGYPNDTCVYDWRRGPDLTPPTRDGKYEIPLDRDGNPQKGVTFGDADHLLSFIQDEVMPRVEDDLFKQAELPKGRKCLFGHSYGGLFTLNALYTRPELFDTFIAASPSIWWNSKSVVTFQEADFLARETPVSPPRALLMTWGNLEQEYERQPNETDEDFEHERKEWAERKMRDNALELAERVRGCASIKTVWHWEFEGEDHGSAAVCGLQKGIMKFLVNKM